MKLFVLKIHCYCRDSYKNNYSFIRYGKNRRELEEYIINYINMSELKYVYDENIDLQKYIDIYDNKYYLKDNVSIKIIDKVYEIVSTDVSTSWTYSLECVDIINDGNDFLIDGESQNEKFKSLDYDFYEKFETDDQCEEYDRIYGKKYTWNYEWKK